MTDKTPLGDVPEGTRMPLDKVSVDGGSLVPAALALSVNDNVATLTVSGGNGIPSKIAVVDEEGQTLAVYTAGPVEATQSRAHFPETWFFDISVTRTSGNTIK